MLRLVYVVLVSVPIIIYYLIKYDYIISHKEQFSESEKYHVARDIVNVIMKKGRIRTEIFGVENLPKDGGYVMYPNHQGKYDALGIIKAHETPCTFLIDKKRSNIPLAREFSNLLDASKLDKTDSRSQITTILDVTRQISDGRRYIVFPEGGYSDNNNDVHKFLPGAFKCSVKSKTPIVPVALIDSYKVFGVNSLKKVKTQVHFLEPLYYEDYSGMNTSQIAELVHSRVSEMVSRFADV